MKNRTDVRLSQRALNRALLARQWLLSRKRSSIATAVEHLCGLQAQVPLAPYLGLWSRLLRFDPVELGQLIEHRRLLRMTLFRGTLHLVTARDGRSLRPLLQPVLERAFQVGSPFGKRLAGVDLESVLAAGRTLIEQSPRSNAQLRKLLGPRWPRRDAEALAYAVAYLLPTVQVPPRGVWGKSGQALMTTLESWLGRPVAARPSPKILVRRYLAAFGPASGPDLQSWSGSAALRATLEELRKDLRIQRDEAGRELFDLPGAPLPDADLPAPPRFLPDFDNVLLGHADRRRIVAQDRLGPQSIGVPTLLIDGFVAARWKIQRERRRAILHITPYQPIRKRDQLSIAAEGTRLLALLASDLEKHDLRFGPIG
jgi:hypothetical protein